MDSAEEVCYLLRDSFQKTMDYWMKSGYEMARCKAWFYVHVFLPMKIAGETC